jgi:hypothetical protein
MDPAGNFVVVWADPAYDGVGSNYQTIQGRRFDSSGTAQGDQFQVNVDEARRGQYRVARNEMGTDRAGLVPLTPAWA